MRTGEGSVRASKWRSLIIGLGGLIIELRCLIIALRALIIGLRALIIGLRGLIIGLRVTKGEGVEGSVGQASGVV
jgi:hypothetical protein